MELPTVGVGGRWNSHWVNVLVAILAFCARLHPICVADGICLCFYLVWVINPYKQSLFDCPGKVLVLPSNYGEVVDVNFMT